MELNLQSMVMQAKNRTPWHFSNEVLYKLCAEHPLHKDPEVVIAKVLLIGRVYAAAIERRKTKTAENDNFYISDVAPRIIASSIDQWIAISKNLNLSAPKSLDVMVGVHAETTQLFSEISGLEKRSLASKYLHFHVPGVFFIYDTRAVTGMRSFGHITGRASQDEGRGDNEYRKFAEKCIRLRNYCLSQFGTELQPRELDNLLLRFAERPSGSPESSPGPPA